MSAIASANTVNLSEPMPGQVAPGFTLKDQSGTEHRLSDYLGFWVVLFFYPRDNTPGCTAEVCRFRDDILEFRALDAVVLGISLDGRARHEKFAQKYELPYPLLSDEEASVSRDYHTLIKFGALKVARRRTFIIDPQGRVAQVYHKVKPKQHSAEVIAELKNLRISCR